MSKQTNPVRIAHLLADGVFRSPAAIAVSLGLTTLQVSSCKGQLKKRGLVFEGRGRSSVWSLPKASASTASAAAVSPTDVDDGFAVAIDDRKMLGIKADGVKLYLNGARALRVRDFIDQVSPMLEPAEE